MTDMREELLSILHRYRRGEIKLADDAADEIERLHPSTSERINQLLAELKEEKAARRMASTQGASTQT